MSEYNIVEGKTGDYVPSRFKPSNVDRFVPVLTRVLTGQRTIRFKHDDIGLNATTAIARVRDAALAVIRGLVFYPDIDADKLRDVWPFYKVSYDHVTREIVLAKYKDEPITTVESIFEFTLKTEAPDFVEHLTCLAWLYGHHKFHGFVVIDGMLDDELKQRLTNEYNVYFRQLKPNEHVMS